MGVQDTFTYQELVFSYCPKLTFTLLGFHFTDWSFDESGQSNIDGQHKIQYKFNHFNP